MGRGGLIYEYPHKEAPIRQGDIFVGVPRIDLSLSQIPVIHDNGDITVASWDDIRDADKPNKAIVVLRSVTAIVVSQDCDTARAPDITLCEIRSFREVEPKSKDTTSPKKWVGILTQHSRINQKWFYLPPDPAVGSKEKMGVDFYVPIRLARVDLEDLRHLRKGRLNDAAAAHFRERISEFFRRYAYDEWYALSPEEMAAYSKEHNDATPFPWQTPKEG